MASDFKELLTKPKNFGYKFSQLIDTVSMIGYQTDRTEHGNAQIRPDLFPTRPHFKYLNNMRDNRNQTRNKKKKDVSNIKFSTLKQPQPKG